MGLGFCRGCAAFVLLWAYTLAAGCQGCKETPQLMVDPALFRLPHETQTLVSLDVRQLRQSSLWAALLGSGQGALPHQKLLATLSDRTGWHPLRDIHRLVLAFPENAHEAGQFAIVIYGENFDERRLVAFARDQASLFGVAITQAEVAGQRAWVAHTSPVRQTGFFVGADVFVLAGGPWGETLAALASQPPKASAAGAEELANLCRRAGAGHAAWLASIVPNAVRAQLAADARFEAASTVSRVTISLSLNNGLALVGRAELSTAEHAASLASQLQRFALEARQSPQVLLLGLGPWLQGVRVVAEGPQVTAQVQLSPDQTQTLIERLSGLLSLAQVQRP